MIFTKLNQIHKIHQYINQYIKNHFYPLILWINTLNKLIQSWITFFWQTPSTTYWPHPFPTTHTPDSTFSSFPISDSARTNWYRRPLPRPPHRESGTSVYELLFIKYPGRKCFFFSSLLWLGVDCCAPLDTGFDDFDTCLVLEAEDLLAGAAFFLAGAFWGDFAAGFWAPFFGVAVLLPFFLGSSSS